MLLGNNVQTFEDHQDTSNNDVLYNAIGMGLAAVLGRKLYKTGALQEIAKPMLEVADKIAREGTDKASMAMSTIKEWTHLKHLTATQMANAKDKTWSAAANSIFRDRDSSIGYDLLQDIKEAQQTGHFSFYHTKRVIDGTRDDMLVLKDMLQYRNAHINDVRYDYTQTDLYERLMNFENFVKTGSHEFSDKMIPFRKKYLQEFVEATSLSAQEAEQELLESGYRKLTLKDIAHVENGKLVMNDNPAIDISSRRNKQYESLLDKINSTFTNSYNRYNNGTIISSGAWENLIVDSGIRVDNTGRVIDYRMTKAARDGFMRSIANDFKLPLVGFNPFKSLLGWDKVGRRMPFGGFLSAEQFLPGVTGMGGRGDEAKLGAFLGRQFGSQYKNAPFAIINGKAYMHYVNEFGKQDLLELGGRYKLHDITHADRAFGLKPSVNAERQIAGLDVGHPESYKYKWAHWLDLGHQEVRDEAESAALGKLSFDSATSIDAWTDKAIYKLTSTKPFRITGMEYETVEEMIEQSRQFNYRNVFGDGFLPWTQKNGHEFNPRMYYASKEHYKISDMIGAIKDKDWEGAKDAGYRFGRQFVAGRNLTDNTMSEYFTEWSTGLWMIPNQLSEALGASSHLLGLSTDSKNNAVSLAGNLLIKRALPVYALTQIPDMLNYLSEPFFGGEDETGNRDNITKWLMRNVVKKFDLVAHSAMDLVGATSLFKGFQEFVPGSDQINELPVIYQLGLGQTREEREDYIENGYDPIRKGRWWGSGNTPFTGGKIMYYRPNIYRRVEADVEFSDSKWGSRQEYYNNTWYPNPINPLAPLNHFIFDRNHYDKKHYYDRPYLETAPAGQNIPIIGPAFAATIGSIALPQQKMHLEYWRNGFQPLPGDEEPSTLLTEGKLYASPMPFSNHHHDIHIYQQVEQQAATAAAQYSNSLYTSAYQAKQVTSRSMVQASGINFQQVNISLPTMRTYDRYAGNPFEVYSTPSGDLSIVDVPDDMNLYNVNQDLQHWSINKVIGTNQRVSLIDMFQGPGITVGNDDPRIDNEFVTQMGTQYNVLADVAGLKGFALQAFITGEANERARMVEDSGYAYSGNKSFWDANMGGLGANLSEITRRFVPKRDNNVEYINPIRNTMPSWMPGSDYFTDFKHGDPYSKIENGEERLPGEGYERLHNISGLLDFNIGSSYIGYSQADIVKHLLGQDGYMSSFEKETLETGNEIHELIEKNWKETGFALETEGKVVDNRNGIIGYYDAMIRDNSSPTGIGIADIKSTSAKKLAQIKLTGQPLDHHRRQVNYYLWATGNTQSKGYIYYIDKDNMNNSYMVGFDYSQELLEDTLNNVYEARKTIRTAIDKGIIGRGELYSSLDQYRILADVAPYSQEFKDAAAKLASEKLSPEEQEEVSRINDRVTAQKEPLRVYDYKFKTSNLKSQTVTVAKVVDNNTIITREYGKDHAIKFAGIRVSESNSELYESHEEEYTDKRGRKRKRTVGTTMNDAARKQISKYIRPGARITIQYDADERNKYSKDSTRSIRAVVMSRGANVNQVLLNKGLAKENENDDSPAGIRARYSKGEIAFGSAMERLTHDVIGKIPFIGSKLFQVRSPYEQYREREVYGKDFQSWNHPIRDILIPHVERTIGDRSLGGNLGGIMAGAFIGSLTGTGKYGALVGATVGGLTTAAGKVVYALGTTPDREWRPKRRREQEKLNEYVDVLKYVKNMRLYEQYKIKARKEDNFDVDKFMAGKQAAGVTNKLRQQELTDYKKKVKLDFKHRDRYNFKYGRPKYVEGGMSRKDTISAINKEIAELQGQRKVTKIPLNAMKAIDFKQQADKTMYAYDPGDSLVDIMSALPKKERQYFKHFIDAPEEEKEKILRIAPSYLRRALQSTWGMQVDRKPNLQEYFQTHALPDANWIGWDEGVNLDSVKVKMVHQNKLDPGEFDLWDKDMVEADQVNVPIPNINATNSPLAVQNRLTNLLGHAGYEDVQMSFYRSIRGNRTSMNIRRDARPMVESQINGLEI